MTNLHTRHLLVAALLCASTPALAQPVDVDPFEAIVANPDGSTTRLNDVSIPVRNPTKSEIRQYVEAFRAINVSANMLIDPSVDSGDIGPFKVKGGTTISFKAGYTKRPGESESVLRTLEMVPSNPMSMGPIKFNKMTLDKNGVLRFKLNMSLMGLDFWPQELTIEKVYRDRDGNTIFKTGGSGLAGKFGPDIRITPTGKVQRYSKGWVFGLFGKGWKDVTEDGAVPSTLTINNWPPKATDLLDWFSGSPEPANYPTGHTDPADLSLLSAIPIKELNLRFTAEADPARIDLADGGGHINLSNHKIDYEANGRFEGRRYVNDPNKRNAYELTAHVTGDVHKPGMPSATIDGLDVRLSGDHEGTIPFDSPEDLSVTAGLRAEVHGELSNVRLNQPGGATIHAPGKTKFDLDATGKLVLRPYTGDPDDKKELVISRDSKYSFSADGPVTIDGVGGMVPDSVTLPDRVTVVAADDPSTPDVDESTLPVLRGEGDMGTKMGFVFTRTNLDVNGKMENGGAIAMLEGNGSSGGMSMTADLKPGARLHMGAYAFAGIKEKDLMSGTTAGGVRMTTDARVNGTIENTKVTANGSTISLPGATDLDARVAANVRHGTRNGAETIVRSVAAEGNLTLREGEGTIEGGLPGGPRVSGRLGAGTSVGFNTGVIRRADPRETLLETEGYTRDEKAAKLRAHLVLIAGSVAHRDFALAFNGRTEIDLTASLGFRFDPNAAAGTPGHPMKAGVDLGISFKPGSTLTFKQPSGNSAKVRLAGDTMITLSGDATVAPDGTPTLNSVGMDLKITAEAIDLKAILDPALGTATTASINSRSTVAIRDAKVSFTTGGGMRIRHNGIVIEIAPGEIVIGG